MASQTLHHPPARHKNEPCCAPTQPPSLNQGRTVALAHRLKAVGDPTRLRMLDLLVQQGEPLCVCDITDQFAQNQPTISHHLRILREAALVDCERRGIWAYYWATSEGRKTLSTVAALA
jgi:ArsR family transcriptional regulator